MMEKTGRAGYLREGHRAQGVTMDGVDVRSERPSG